MEFTDSRSSDFNRISELLKGLRSIRFYRTELDTHALLDIPDRNIFTSAKVSCWFKWPDGEAAEDFFSVS